MQCSCAGATTSREAVKGIFRLEFLFCPACGRIGGEILYLKGSMIQTGLGARQAFNRLNGEKPHG